jgi:small subunit ribosomal protein S2
MVRMQKNFAGIVEMGELPSAMFVVDVSHNDIAVAEAERCGIKSVGLVDTNSDPTKLTYPIPGNDDAVKSIRIIVDAVMEAIQSGLNQRESRRGSRQQADLKAASAAVAVAAGVPEGEVDVSNIELPVDAPTGDTESPIVVPKPVRKKIAAPRSE